MMELTTKLPSPSPPPSIQIISICITLLRLILGITLLTLSILTMRYNNNDNNKYNGSTTTATTFREKLTGSLLHTLHSHFNSSQLDFEDDEDYSTASNALYRLAMAQLLSWIPRITATGLAFYLGLVYGYVGLCQLGLIRPARSL